MVFSLTIQGVAYDAFDRRNSINIQEALQANGQSMQLVLFIPDQAIATPLAGQQIIFKRDGILEFAGRLATVSQDQQGLQVNLNYQLSCVDYTGDFDNTLLQQNYVAQVAGDTIREIVGDVGRDFTSVHVVNGPVINAVEADLETPSSVVTRIAESIEHQWYVDFDRDVNFFYILDRPAPIDLIDLDTDLNTYFDAEIEEQWEQVKNVIYLSGAKARSTVQDNITNVSDGDQRFYPLNYEPWNQEDITVTVDGIPQNILLDGVDGSAGDGLGNAGDAYICIDNWGIRFPEAHGPAADADVVIDYSYVYEPIIKVEDPVSIAAMKARENIAGAASDGIHEFKFEIPDLRVTDENAIWDYGNLILQRYANPIFLISFGSRVQGWRAGQFFRVISASDKRNFDKIMYVQTVNKSIHQSSGGVAEFEYTITASSSPFPA